MLGLFPLLGGLAWTAPAPALQTRAGLQAFVGARVFDGTAAPILNDGVVIVRDGRIEAVGPRSQVSIPAGAEVIDLTGRWLVPGFVNAHGHVSGDAQAFVAQLEQYAHYGITTVVSLGGNETAGFPLRDAQSSPDLRRARVFLAGPVLNPGSAADAAGAVAGVAELRANWVKIRVDGGLQGGASMSPEVYGAVMGAARSRGLPVAIHIWELEAAKGVVRAGGSLVAHSVRDQAVDRELIDLLLERDVCLVPTLTRELSTFVYAERPAFFDDPFFLEGAAPADLAGFMTPQRIAQATGEAGQFWREALPLAQSNMAALHQAGVGIAMGTDSGPAGRFQGYFEHVEMEMMVQGGMSPRDVLIAATGGAADCLDLEGLGTIRAGSWGDLVALEADPTVDIRNTRRIYGVWTSGNRIR